jgi:two-component system nitrogen regulation response regulator GlnG
MPRILIVDDEPSICWGLSQVAVGLGCEARTAASAEDGLRLADSAGPFDLVLLDVRLPMVDGLTAMAEFQLRTRNVPVIVMTAFGDLSTALRAVDGGAFEYVVKPFDAAEIRAAMQRALRKVGPAAQRRENEPRASSEPAAMIGRSPAMQAVFKQLALAARSDAPVLLCGESGVGKQSAARTLHAHSARRDGPFIPVNLAAASPAFMEAELFGVAAGVLGAGGVERPGAIASAHGGTLFLEEPAALTPPLQIKLLEALERGEVAAVGSPSRKRSSFRLIASSVDDFTEEVRRGTFREDLSYRISTCQIVLPPLRERREDIVPLALEFAAQVGLPPARLAAETLEELQRRTWRGNLRELRRAIEHAFAAAPQGAILPTHLPPEQVPPEATTVGKETLAMSADSTRTTLTELARTLLGDPSRSGVVYEQFLNEVEPALLNAALQCSGRQCAPAARLLGLHRTTLKRKLQQYGIDHVGAGESS